MLITGNQLKAARALIGVDQAWVANAANVAINTIRNMEGRGAEPITSGAVTVRNVQLVLESAGAEFINGGQPGVRLMKHITMQNWQEAAALPIGVGARVTVTAGDYETLGKLAALGFNDAGGSGGKRIMRRDTGVISPHPDL
ncbi:MAG: hypothetical protein JO051_00815 [Acidobacteriaceae bacterium]|jgi:hypothetical protein|nr:hypothetical protein [Acidobacteriaceae bacterium]